MDELRFDGKVAIVTGAGRGLGRDYALLLARRGAHVVVNDLGHGPDGSPSDETPANEVVAEISAFGGQAIASRGNVISDADAIVQSAIDSFGRLDILINNAGYSGGGLFPDISQQDWDAMICTHVGGAVNMSRAAWPHLAAAGAGRIVNMSSASAFGGPYTSHYATAKSAMIGLTRSLAGEGAAVGLTMNTVMPSAYTRLTAQIPDERLRDYLSAHFPPSRVAPFVAWLAHEATTVNGEIFSVGGGTATRVVLAVTDNIHVSEDTPEQWAKKGPELLKKSDLEIPMNMIEKLCHELRSIDAQGAAMADAIKNTNRF
jgi:NAD(P)-dependent dehydrogenase (short-subunit alcohol dehydrogenase family)